MLRAALDGQELGAEARQQMNVAQAQDGSTNALAEVSAFRKEWLRES